MATGYQAGGNQVSQIATKSEKNYHKDNCVFLFKTIPRQSYSIREGVTLYN